MFTRIQNRYNDRVANVVAMNEALDLVEIVFEDDKSTKMITIEQLHKNWFDLNQSTVSDKKLGRPFLSTREKTKRANQRRVEKLDTQGTFEYIHNKALESGMICHQTNSNTYSYKLPESTMMQIRVRVWKTCVNMDLRSTLLGYPLADNDKFYHLNYYYNRQLRITNFTKTQQNLVDKIIEKLSAEPQIVGCGRRRGPVAGKPKKKRVIKTKKDGRQTKTQLKARAELAEKEN